MLLFVAFCYCKRGAIALKSPSEMRRDAIRARPRELLAEYRETIEILRHKDYSWREIAQFLAERGVEIDHTKIFRFMKQQGEPKTENTEVFVVPSAEEYAKALTAIKISEPQMKMFEAHYRAHNRTMTYTELAKAAGSDDYRTANLHYGKLGYALGEQVGMAPWVFNGTPFYSGSIGLGSPSKSEESHFQITMHHEVAKAIERLGWFK
jgi:hypothetical protein